MLYRSAACARLVTYSVKSESIITSLTHRRINEELKYPTTTKSFNTGREIRMIFRRHPRREINRPVNLGIVRKKFACRRDSINAKTITHARACYIELVTLSLIGFLEPPYISDECDTLARRNHLAIVIGDDLKE